jgi:hypothetical protein
VRLLDSVLMAPSLVDARLCSVDTAADSAAADAVSAAAVLAMPADSTVAVATSDPLTAAALLRTATCTRPSMPALGVAVGQLIAAGRAASTVGTVWQMPVVALRVTSGPVMVTEGPVTVADSCESVCVCKSRAECKERKEKKDRDRDRDRQREVSTHTHTLTHSLTHTLRHHTRAILTRQTEEVFTKLMRNCAIDRLPRLCGPVRVVEPTTPRFVVLKIVTV